MPTRFFRSLLLALVLCSGVTSMKSNDILTISDNHRDFILSAQGRSASLLVDSNDYPGVIRALKDLQADIDKVTGAEPRLITDPPTKARTLVIVGTLGHSELIKTLVQRGKIVAKALYGKWESYQISVVSKPISGIDKALVIVGSDKRGTIYGIYELSAAIGVSPWYWWADAAPGTSRCAVCELPGCHIRSPLSKIQGYFSE